MIKLLAIFSLSLLAFGASARAEVARADRYRAIESLRQRWRAGEIRESVTAEDVATAGEWLDLLEDEGCIHPGGFEITPLRLFDSMNLARKQMVSNSPDLANTVNALVGKLDQLCSAWYADGTIGNISHDWSAWSSLTVKTADADRLVLSVVQDDQNEYDLTITAYTGGIFRIHGPAEGFFKADALTSAKMQIERDADMLKANVDGAAFEVAFNPMRLRILKGSQVVWEVISLQTLADPQDDAVAAVRQENQLGPLDRCFGFGERFGSVDHRGRVLNNWVSDSIFSGIRSKWTEAYKPVPLWVNPRGASTFFNEQSLLRSDLGAMRPDRATFSARGAVLDEYIFVGDPMTALRGYTALTGRPTTVPDWALAPWLGGGTERWKARGADKTCEAVRSVIMGMNDLDIPFSAVYIEGVPTAKREGEELLSWLQTWDVKPLAWYGPAMSRGESFGFSTDEREHLIIRQPGGKPFIVPLGRFLSGQVYIDYTNPLCDQLLLRRWKWHIEAGIRGCMIDGGEEAPRDAALSNGLNGEAMHNLYPLFYHAAHQRLFQKLVPNDFILFARSGAPGDQSNLGQFPGDLPSDFGGLTAAIHAGLTAGASGFSIWGSDIGGYYLRDGKPRGKDVYVRWLQFGAFSPLCRFHHEKMPSEPLMYDQEAIDIDRFFMNLRMNLQPYLIGLARQSHEVGEPMIRALGLVYPADEPSLAVDDEYMLGPDLLVAPIHSADATRQIYLPPGAWYDLLEGVKKMQGGRTLTRQVPLSKMPVFARAGAVLPLQLDSDWQLGDSTSGGSERVLLVLPPVDGGQPSTVTETAACREGDDLLVRCGACGNAVSLWIPSQVPHEVDVNQKQLPDAGQIPPPGAQATFFDAASNRLCIRLDGKEKLTVRVIAYYTDKR